MPHAFLYLLTFLLYAGVALYIRQLVLPGSRVAAGSVIVPRIHGLIVLPLGLHALLLLQSINAEQGLVLGVGSALSLILWLTVLTYWLAGFRLPLVSAQLFLLPLAALGVALHGLLPVPAPLSHVALPAFRAHMLVSLLAYGLLTVAAFHAGLMALVEKRLHERLMPGVLSTLPPLLSLERLLFQLVWAGFVLLSLTLLTGVMFSEALFGKPFQFSHKTLFATLSWLTFAALLAGRHVRGWRGRVAIRWTLAGFAMLVLAYLGSKFVFEVILHR